MSGSRAERATPSLIDGPEVRTARIASVALLRPIDKTYSYIVPDELADRVQPGMRVIVPFGPRDQRTEAFCLSVSEQPWDSTVKPILQLIDEAPLLDSRRLELGRWIARYYASHLGRTLDLMVPAAAKRRAGRRKVKYAVLTAAAPPLSPPPRSGGQGGGANAPTPPSDLHRTKLTQKQTSVLERLTRAGGAMPVGDCCDRAGCTAAVIKSLERKGAVAIEIRAQPVLPEQVSIPRREPDFELNEDQRAAVARIGADVDAPAFSVQVLYGVTGSGKTEVYIAAMRRALAAGRQAVMLVPEIALTTQTVRRLQERFDRVATLHSGLSEVQRARAWAAVAEGTIRVVIGTRSAVFAPCPNLGVIIVDEEAEPSYKNQAAPRYHTRDVAILRARLEDVPIVLGSATPSLETWNNLKRRPHYHLIRLPHRVRGLAMPHVHLVDMRTEHRARRGVHLLSRAMELHLTRTLERREQAVLLLNRRGYASYLHCARCSNVITCPHCSVNMVLHATTRLAHCHYCHARLVVPNRCQTAGCDGTLIRFGMGTQRVEAELREKFPAARVRRIDSDVMSSAADYADILGAFERKAFDCLIGTQMVAKGLDFPFVSFVGVVSADTSLGLDDFRSEERTFQLVLQVAGRSGRGEAGGEVVVQTFSADTAPIRHAVAGDFEGFAKTELDRRREAGLPPFSRMVRVVLADPRMTRLRSAAEKLVEDMRHLLNKRGLPCRVFDARPAAIARIRDRYRYDLLLIFPTAKAMMSAMDVFKDEGTLRPRVKGVVVDVDPVSMQ